MEEEWLLTTSDNPYNPFTQWDEWYAFDVSAGHHTCALLDRVTIDGEDLDTGGIAYAQAEIVRFNVSGLHLLVTEQMFDELMTVV